MEQEKKEKQLTEEKVQTVQPAGQWRKLIPCVPAKYLLLIAALVWMIAGSNILRIGVPDFVSYWNQNFMYLIGAAAIFFIFMIFIFYRLVQKHNVRILMMEEDLVPVYRFFDKKSYLMMIFMISGGMLLRSARLLPGIAIGIMYSGIGVSLLGAGVLFLQKFAAAMIPADPQG